MEINEISHEELQNQLLTERLNALSFSDLRSFKILAIDSYNGLIEEASPEDKTGLKEGMEDHVDIINQVIQRKAMGVFFPTEY
jgi:hypothetical protein